MDHFVDIQLLPDPELTAPVLMGALYARLHRTLVTLEGRAGDIAVSLPGYSARPGALGVGNCLRLLGSPPGLQTLASANWLGGLRDQVSVSAAAAVPAAAQQRCLRRVQAQSSPERLRRRLIKRHGVTEAQARAQIPDSATEMLNLPYLPLRSASTGQNFRLFLRLGPPQPSAAPGNFNAYGLSTTATTPWF